MRIIVGATMLSFALASSAYGQQISLGVVSGTNVTANFPITDFSGPADDFGNPAFRFRRGTGPRSFIVGASLEGRLSERFSIEANVLHRPMRTTINFTEFLEDGSTRASTDTFTAVRAWEFPVMLKYTLPPSRFSGRVRPFLAVGPSFRTQEDSSATEPSRLGISAGAGASIALGRFRISPTLRYTRWRRESIAPRFATKPDQLEFLAAFAYETDSGSRRVAGRKLEIGAVVGSPLTGGFPERVTAGVYDERAGYLAGLSAQMAVKRNLSVEVNAIYKPFRARGELGSTFSVLTWQFPVLAKYRCTRPNWTPFVEAGPSFRLAGNLNGFNPSHYGVTAGAGIETRAGGLRLAPTLRYTRWARDTIRAFLQTNPNAVEVVFGVSF